MPTIVDRDRIVRLLGEQFAAVALLGGSLTDAQWSTATCLPGWTVKDLVSHMAGTEHMLAGDKAPDVQVPEVDYLRNDIGKSNEVWVEANRPLGGAQVLADFEEVTGRRRQALEAMTQADMDVASWTPAGPNETYGRFMRIRHFDCFMHEHDIRAALGSAPRDDADHVRSCLEEVATALGYIVGRKAGMPAGSAVRIELTGSVPAVYYIAVEERAEVRDSLEGEPTVAVRMPGLLWLRLTGGRESADAHIGEDIVIEGDEVLARQLVSNLSFTI